jgi:uncharacterized protein (TIGR02145 family)
MYNQIFGEKMIKLFFMFILTIPPILAQCDWSGDGGLDVIDVVETVDCVLNGCWDGSQCDWTGDGEVNVIDVVQTVDCILNDCWIPGCTDPTASNYNPDALFDDGSCEYENTCIDFDGNIYETIQLGSQVWMAENLKVTHYNNGESIPTDLDYLEWIGAEMGAYAVFLNDPSNGDSYGNLYNWFAVEDDRGVCPEGFHIPSDDEFVILEMYLGMSYEDAYDIQWRGTNQGSQLAGNGDLWTSGDLVNNPAFGTSDYDALPAGFRDAYQGNYVGSGSIGLWSTTSFDIDHAWSRLISYNHSGVNRGYANKHFGLSVRCVEDTEQVSGCPDPIACNYTPDVNEDDGSCWYSEEYYDCDGNCYNDIDGDAVCDELEVLGCTDPEAINFDPNATDDGTCEFVDIDGNEYQTIMLGNQVWMAENLKVTHYNNGDPIPTGISNGEWQHDNVELLEFGAYAIYDDDPANADIYGNLYNWYAVDDERGICPEGFHMPSDEEWMILEMYLGMSYDESQDLWFRGTDQGSQLAWGRNLWFGDSWIFYSALKSNPSFGTSGFLAFPGGLRQYFDGVYNFKGISARFWSSTTTDNSDEAFFRNVLFSSSAVGRQSVDKRAGYSVRCLRVDEILLGCPDPFACNYNSDANEDDGSCWYSEEYYDCDGNCLNDADGDGACDDLEIFGCMDSEALNFNPEVTEDNGTCIYSAGIIEDYDGNEYQTLDIGNQIWMAGNLKVTHYNSGDAIPTGFNDSDWEDLGDTETGAFAIYDNDPFHAEIYGNLYNWYAVNEESGICPEGFHIPSDEEWMVLEMNHGMSNEDINLTQMRGGNQGSQLAGIADLWNSGDLNNNPTFGSSGFLGIPAGQRLPFVFSPFQSYEGMNSIGIFWTSTTQNNNNNGGWLRTLQYPNSGVGRFNGDKRTGISVRCLEDSDQIPGCPNESACNYNPDANFDIGGCWYAENYYNCNGNCLHDYDGDGVCWELEVSGCSDQEAFNFNPDATEDDGSCIYDTVTDIDGNTYSVILIGEQYWTAENLRVTHYNNGATIQTGLTGPQWDYLENTHHGAYAVYNNNPDNADIYGNLYNWYAVDDDRGICPENFHVPSDYEWRILEVYLGMSNYDTYIDGWRGTDQGSQLSGNESLWTDGDLDNHPSFGSSGLDLLPGGVRESSTDNYGYYSSLHNHGEYWTKTNTNYNYAWRRTLYTQQTDILRSDREMKDGLSIRCIAD